MSRQVLHVVEALGGGVASALESYIARTSEFAHTVCAFRRLGHDVGDKIDEIADVIVMPEGKAAQLAFTRRLLSERRADMVHAHSSWAGAYVRALTSSRHRVGYSPHCYAFERRDVRAPVRRGFWIAEKWLAARTDVTFAVSPREADLATRLSRRTIVRRVPPALSPLSLQECEAVKRGSVRGSGDLVVATVGRVSPQKDIRFFLDVVDAYRRKEKGRPRRVVWRWIGGGPPSLERHLTRAEIEVTGWMTRDQTFKELARADAYLHTAAWEAGIPYSVLEAVALGVPAAVRSIPATIEAPAVALGSTPDELAVVLDSILASRPGNAIIDEWRIVTSRFADEQRASLTATYGA